MHVLAVTRGTMARPLRSELPARSTPSRMLLGHAIADPLGVGEEKHLS
jgi:hypothetical protein